MDGYEENRRFCLIKFFLQKVFDLEMLKSGRIKNFEN